MMVQLNIGRNVKHLITILLLSSFITVSAQEAIPSTALEDSDITIIVPGMSSLESETPAVTIPNMTPEQCGATFKQMQKLTQVVTLSDKKASETRIAIRAAVDARIVPEFTVNPNWAAISPLLNVPPRR